MNGTKMVEFGEVTMSSLEIAELVESRHDSVKRTIERLANKGVIEFPPTVEIPTATKPTTVYQFSGDQGRRDSIIVVVQLSPEFTARLVDRWQELENQIIQPKLSENYIKDLVESEVKKQLAKKPASRKKKKTEAIDFSDAAIAANEALASKGEGRPLFDFITALSLVFPRELVRASIKDMGLINDNNWGLPSEYAILKGWMYFTTLSTCLGWGEKHLTSTCVFITPKCQNQIMDILRK